MIKTYTKTLQKMSLYNIQIGHNSKDDISKIINYIYGLVLGRYIAVE